MWRWGVGRGVLDLVAVGLVALACVAALVSSGEAALPGRNGRIAFVWDPGYSVRPQSCGDIFTIEPSGLGRRRLTRGCPWIYGAPAYSAAGTRIAFVRQPESSSRHLHGAGIYVMNADGSNIRRLTASSNDANPSFSSDGRWLVFNRYLTRSRTTQIFLASVGGSEVHELTRRQRGAADPSLSGNGHEIAFVAGSGSSIDTMRLDGSHVRRLAHVRTGSFGFYADPDFSPNGRWIVFICGVAPGLGSIAQVCVMRTDDGHLRHLTPVSWMLAKDPVFSPDGRRIAFLAQLKCRSRCRGNGDVFLYTMQTNGSHLRRVFDLGPNQELGSLDISWQPLP